MVTESIPLYILAALIILLGGLSLILQKIYKVDEQGKETVIDVPFFGKLTTNYPAIAFVFIGSILAAYAYNKAMDIKSIQIHTHEKWTIAGKLIPPEGETINFDNGEFTYSNRKCHYKQPDQTGEFEIKCDIPHGKKLIDEIIQINFTCKEDEKTSYMANIDVSHEVNNYNAKKDSIIDYIDKNKIRYKDFTLALAKKP